MRYNLELIHGLCEKWELYSNFKIDGLLAIELCKDVALFFRNHPEEDDCLVGFEGAPWHAHGDFMFADSHGNDTEMDYLSVVSVLKDGLILVGGQWLNGRLMDRWLIHRHYDDLFKFIDRGEEIRVSRPELSSSTR